MAKAQVVLRTSSPSGRVTRHSDEVNCRASGAHPSASIPSARSKTPPTPPTGPRFHVEPEPDPDQCPAGCRRGRVFHSETVAEGTTHQWETACPECSGTGRRRAAT